MEEIRSALAKCNCIPGSPDHKSWPIHVQLHPKNGRLPASLLGRNNLLSELNNLLHTQYRIQEDLTRERQESYMAARADAKKRTSEKDLGQMWK
jgi:hypothetical protein